MIEGDELPPLPNLTVGTRVTASAIPGWGIPVEAKKRANSSRLEVLTPTARKNGVQWEVSVSEGKVAESVIPGASAINYITIINLSTAGVPIWHPVASGDYGYVSYDVAIDGSISNTPTFSINAAELVGVHYYPQAFSYAGAAGAIKAKLFKFTIVDGVPFFEYFQSAGDLVHYRERAAWGNAPTPGGMTGDRHEIGKDYSPSEDKYWLKPIIQFPGGIPILHATASTHIAVKSLFEAETTPQIKITNTADGKGIRIEGNAVAGDNDSVTVVDGLVTAVKTTSAGWWGTVNWRFYVNILDATPYEHLQHKYENGKLVEVKYQGPGGSLTTVAGTQASLGTANFASFATP